MSEDPLQSVVNTEAKAAGDTEDLQLLLKEQARAYACIMAALNRIERRLMNQTSGFNSECTGDG